MQCGSAGGTQHLRGRTQRSATACARGLRAEPAGSAHPRNPAAEINGRWPAGGRLERQKGARPGRRTPHPRLARPVGPATPATPATQGPARPLRRAPAAPAHRARRRRSAEAPAPASRVPCPGQDARHAVPKHGRRLLTEAPRERAPGGTGSEAAAAASDGPAQPLQWRCGGRGARVTAGRRPETRPSRHCRSRAAPPGAQARRHPP